jgi:Spy/CpxP family protein refolding chaperone
MVFKTKHFGIIAAAIMLGVGLWVLPGFAQMRHGGGGRAGGPNLFFLMRAAQLTPDQKTQVHTLIQNSRQNSQQIVSQLVPLRQQLNSALYSTGTANPNLISQVNALESQLQQERYSVFQQVWSLLNSTQQNQVTTLYSQMAANRAQQLNMWKSLHQQQQNQ